MVHTSGEANHLAARLAAGSLPRGTPPTNDPEGWAAYARIFADLLQVMPRKPAERSFADRLFGCTPTSALPISLPDNYSPDDLKEDSKRAQHVPDLSKARYALDDILIALEWRRTVHTWFTDERFGDKTLIDIADITVEAWATKKDHSLERGLLGLKAQVPT